MKLSDLHVNHLVGFYKSNIDNDIILCDGVIKVLNDHKEEIVAEAYRFDILSPEGLIKSSVLGIFNQVNDSLIFLYRKDKYLVTAITSDSITLEKDGVNYLIASAKLPLFQ